MGQFDDNVQPASTISVAADGVVYQMSGSTNVPSAERPRPRMHMTGCSSPLGSERHSRQAAGCRLGQTMMRGSRLRTRSRRSSGTNQETSIGSGSCRAQKLRAAFMRPAGRHGASRRAEHRLLSLGRFARQADTILCPYCATRYRFDPRLRPFEADPPDSLFVDPDPIWGHRAGVIARVGVSV